MALGNGGLDAQVEQRMDAYRGNPQQLKKRSAISKDLIDLLAMQKIEKEKQAVAADMQLKMQQQPGTIAEQLEKRLLDSTKQEMSGTLGQLAANTKGTLDQKQSLQNKNMNKMAQNASKPQPGTGAGLAGLMGGGARPPARPPVRPSQGGGVEGMLMARNAARRGGPQSGPVRMAQGGIVSFADGKKVTLTEDQKTKAREIYGPLYDDIIGNLLNMDADNPAAAPILNRLGPAVQSTAISRGIDNIKSLFSTNVAQTNLQNDVKEKFRYFAAPVTGAFIQQSPEQQAYAKQVLSSVDSLSEGELQALLDAPFESGMDPTIIASLPNVFPEPTVTADAGPQTIEETDAQVGNSPQVTYPTTYEDPQDFLSGVDTSFVPEIAEAPSTDSVVSAEAALTAAANRTADADLLKVDSPVVPELQSVDPAYSDVDQKRYDGLLNIYADDAMIDPEGVGNAARADSDAHLRRAENSEDYRRMLKEEKELQARLFNPERLANEARIATFGGASRGRGGMSAAYLDVMNKQRGDLTEGLGRLRGIDDKRITTDLSTAQTSSARGSEAAGRAAQRRAGGLGAIEADFARKDARSLQQQRLQSQANIATYEHQSALAQKTYGAAEATISRNFRALGQLLISEQTFYQEQVNINIAAVEQKNEARKAELDKLLEVAKQQAEYAFKDGELALKTVNELETIRRDTQQKATELITERMALDPLYTEVMQKMQDMAGSENSSEFEGLKAEAQRIYDAHLKTLMSIAPLIFGEQELLKDYIAAAQAASPFQGGRLPRDTSVTPLDNPVTSLPPPDY